MSGKIDTSRTVTAGDFPLWATDRLRYADLDPVGHINNAAFSTFFETGRVTLVSDHVGPLIGGPTTFAIVKLTIEFLAELHYPGEVRIGTRIDRIGRSSMNVAQALYAGDTLSATAETVMVQIDRNTRTSLPFSDEIRSRLQALM
jgi:acyl-CoA thioester hydrolase